MRRSRPRISVTLRFALVALVCVAAMGVAVALDMRAGIRENRMDDATRTARLVTDVSVAPHLAVLAAPHAAAESSRDAAATAISAAAASADVDRLTILAADGRVLYPLDGRAGFVAAAERERVLATAAPVTARRTLDGEARVQVLVPVDRARSALAEVTFDAAPIDAAIAGQTRELYIVLGIGLGFLYAFLLPMLYAMTLRLRRREAERRYATDFDALTGLPNRTRFHAVVSEHIAGIDDDATFALMLIDLDRFRAINDTLGHDRGDLVIHEIATRLRQTLRDTDLVARLGGDEFAVMLRGVPDGAAALVAAGKVRAGLEHPISLDGTTIDIAASIGIALSPVDGRDVTALMQKADVALYAAKAARGGARVYDSAADANTPERLGMIAELRHAIEHGELVLHYQPKARLDDGMVEGVEALVRWRHPERGLVPPIQFIPLAEETGLIKEITVWVVDEALRQAHEWRRRGTALPISVNISAQNLHDPDLTGDIAARLRAWEADSDWIRLEITESAVMENPEDAMRGLADLAGMGLELAMDDYGTGYSALNYLKLLPLSELKIDRAFVANVTADRTDALIIGSTIELGHSLGLRIVGEGVETEADWIGLQTLGCDVAQGFFLGRPMPADEFEAWLRDSGRGLVDHAPIAPDQSSR